MLKEFKTTLKTATITFYSIMGVIMLLNILGKTNFNFVYALQSHVIGLMIITVLSLISAVNSTIKGE